MKNITIITTKNCAACETIKNIIENVRKDNPTFTISSYDFSKTPEFIKTQVKLTDFPTVVLLDKKDIIKYSFSGTLSKKRIEKLMKDINF